jgi:hypothetical protein
MGGKKIIGGRIELKKINKDKTEIEIYQKLMLAIISSY